MKCNDKMIFKTDTFSHTFQCDEEKNHSGPHTCENNNFSLTWKYRNGIIRDEILKIFKDYKKNYPEMTLTNKIIFIESKYITKREQVYNAIQFLLKRKLIKKVSYDEYILTV